MSRPAGADPRTALVVRDLEVWRGAPPGGFALRVPALDLRRGEVLAVLGANGAGKSTLLHALAGLLPPRAGAVTRLAPGAPGLVFQRPALLAGSVRWNVEVALWRRGIPRRERRRRALAALARFGVAGLARRRASELSGGEGRRVALARAFAAEPAVLLLDEPFDDLDAAARETLLDDLGHVIRESGAAVALVTHELRQALPLADRIAVLVAGRLVQIGERDEVLRRPASTAVAQLVGMGEGMAGVVRARRADGLAEIEPVASAAPAPAPQPEAAGATPLRIVAATRLPVGTSVWVGVRPEHVHVESAATRPALEGAAGLPPARVESCVSDGALVVVRLGWGPHRLRAHLLAGRAAGAKPAVGDTVSVSVAPEDVHVLETGAG